MMQFFILGRNPELSREEIISYLNARAKAHKEILFKKNYLILDLNTEVNIQELGGVIKSGNIEFSGNQKEFGNFIEKNDLTEKEKFTYSIIGNIEEDYFIDKFKQEKRKAIIRRGRKSLKIQREDAVALTNADIEFFAYEEEVFFFGKVNQTYSYKEQEKRDMNKPVRRAELAISPRLAKILINLSGAKQGDLILDPFCGIAGILQEALLMNIDCIGIDVDKRAIENAKRNLQYIKNNYKFTASYKLINQDSRKAPDKQFDAIATESSLGKLVKKSPNDNEAKQIIQEFEYNIIQILQRLRNIKKAKAKIAITFPFIRNRSVDLEKIQYQTRLKLLTSVKEYREEQFIGREILVFN